MAGQPISELFLNNIYVLPLWVKQVLYLKTRDKLRGELAEFMEVLLKEPLMQSYVPKLTLQGQRELDEHSGKLPEEFYIFYQHCAQGHDLFEIALANYWTFSQTCSIFTRAFELEHTVIPDDEKLVAIAQFMAGKTKTGELLKRLGKITIVQLEKAIRIQRERNATGENIKIAELLIELGYITDADINILLAFKDDAKKRFVMGVGFSLVKPTNENEANTLVRNMQKEIKRLDEENRILKNRLRKILNIKE